MQDLGALATRDARRISVLIWNYSDDSAPGPASPVQLKIDGVPESAGRVRVAHYRIDDDHSNSFTAWKADGIARAADSGAILCYRGGR